MMNYVDEYADSGGHYTHNENCINIKLQDSLPTFMENLGSKDYNNLKIWKLMIFIFGGVRKTNKVY